MDLELDLSEFCCFAERFWAKIKTWREKIEHIRESGQSAVVWGAGSKGVTFLNLIDPIGQIEYIIDINPRKQGKYVPGTGQNILPPEFLREYQPDVVLVMNEIYKDEIQQILDSFFYWPFSMNIKSNNSIIFR